MKKQILYMSSAALIAFSYPALSAKAGLIEELKGASIDDLSRTIVAHRQILEKYERAFETGDLNDLQPADARKIRRECKDSTEVLKAVEIEFVVREKEEILRINKLALQEALMSALGNREQLEDFSEAPNQFINHRRRAPIMGIVQARINDGLEAFREGVQEVGGIIASGHGIIERAINNELVSLEENVQQLRKRVTVILGNVEEKTKAAFIKISESLSTSEGIKALANNKRAFEKDIANMIGKVKAKSIASSVSSLLDKMALSDPDEVELNNIIGLQEEILNILLGKPHAKKVTKRIRGLIDVLDSEGSEDIIDRILHVQGGILEDLTGNKKPKRIIKLLRQLMD